MRFLIDAQLPRRLAFLLTRAGHDSLHTLDLPQKNSTPDEEINRVAAQEGRIVVTKDDDFVNSFLLRRAPPLLLLVATGNITNADLEALFSANLLALETAFTTHHFVELGRDALVLRG